MTRKVFHFDFSQWYGNGYWGDNYIPYSILDQDEIVANVSISIISFLVNNVERRFIQIGTVMTHDQYRNLGLNRWLLERVLKLWRGQCDLIYLFANKSVRDLYPKFGFSAVQEYQHSKAIEAKKSNNTFDKLNMYERENENLVYQIIKKSSHFSSLSMIDNASLVMFYCTSFMQEEIYYSEALGAIAIATYEQNTLHIKSLFCEKDIPIDEAIYALAKDKIDRVSLGFTPKESDLFDVTFYKPHDALFILDDKRQVFDGFKGMFPLLSHA